ncbi:hypothetical protein BAE46_12310 [Glaciecola punicea]|uniref:NAD-dependent epimerase/dehydratase family protein n=1 Tax=Glaciecola punicea TaxID=56804 RepID=UPI0008726C91|nr:NAD-dependent epimerase/dehydratase family protein [Glaciecola punicea]OFA30153.1 hypothetical protein BAE46_12310 [Glaciecola punicea]
MALEPHVLTREIQHKFIHIMGLGWLGRPLASVLQQYGANVSGSVTSASKQQMLLTESLTADIFDLYKPINKQYTSNGKVLATRFTDASLVLNIPPGRTNFSQHAFVNSMIALIDCAMQNGLQQLIFISTTSVFGEQHGKVNQHTAVQAKTESGKAHQAIEAHLALYYPDKSKVLRPSGLIGPNPSDTSNKNLVAPKMRHPIYSLCNKSDIPNANDPVNLIHQADVIQAILALLSTQPVSHAFNLSALAHPSRKAYYQWCAKRLALPIPTFLHDPKERQLGKLIDATQSFIDLDFTPTYASPFDML